MNIVSNIIMNVIFFVICAGVMEEPKEREENEKDK